MADHARRIPATLLVVTVALVGGCSPVASPTPAVALADRLNAGLAEGSQSFGALFASAQLGDSWYAVLQASSAQFDTTSEPDQVSVSTRFVGDARTATETLTLTFDAGGRITGTADRGPRPLWAITPVELTTTSRGTVMSAGLTPSARAAWSQRLAEAEEAVAASGLVTGDFGLVVEVPADAAGFTAVSGAAAADTAAITGCESGTSRIVINPVAAERGSQWLQTTLVHEAVHAATESACHQGTPWVVEGAAEAVAAATDAATAKNNRSLVKAYLHEHPVPTTLPSQLTTATDYALAAVAVQALRQHQKVAANATIRRGIEVGLTTAEEQAATTWYRAALAELR